MQAVDILNISITPIPPGAEQRLECENCSEYRPRWTVLGKTYCSRCFLHDELKEQADRVETLIGHVEKSLGGPLERDDKGRLREIGADRIVGGLVIAQRYELGRLNNEKG